MLRWPSPRLLPLTILAIAAVLVLKTVALIRIVPDGAAVPAPIAEAQAAPEPAHAATEPSEAKHAAPEAAPAAAGTSPVSASEKQLLLDLRKRRQQLDARAAALDTREQVVSAAERRLSARVDELTALQKKLESLDSARKQRDEANWQGLVKLYATMRPRDAAAIFNDLDMPVLLPVLDRMKESRAAPILAAMQPEKARQVTDALARLRTNDNKVGDNKVGG